MLNKSANDVCYSQDCEYNYPYMRAHTHVRTPDGTYVKFIVEKPKYSEIKEITDADTRR